MTGYRIPVLAVRQPWAGLIASGKKTIELRNFPTPVAYIGKKIAIYASRTNPKADDLKHVGLRRFMYDFSVQDPTSIPSDCIKFGEILATATIKSCQTYVSSGEFSYWESEHWAPLSYYKPQKTHFWFLSDIQALKNPVPFKFPRGAVVWTSVDSDFLEAV